MGKLSVVHLTHHTGCASEIEAVGDALGFSVATWFTSEYNIGPAAADRLWEENKELFLRADLAIVSDTAPLARILLQHFDEFKGRLVVWVCTRFDYADQATNDCGFPDPGYYELVRSSVANQRVRWILYTAFEGIYSRRQHDIDLGATVVKPTGSYRATSWQKLVPEEVKDGFFVPDRHNDRMFSLRGPLRDRRIPHWTGQYGGPKDLVGFRGVIHVPYAWSNFALFEGWALGLVYYIPDEAFLLDISRKPDFFWSPPWDPSELATSEWYDPAHEGLTVKFRSWDHLRDLSAVARPDVGEAAMAFVEESRRETLARWAEVLELA